MAQSTQLAYRTLKGLGVLNATPVYENLPGFERPEGNFRCCCYSPDGRFFAWASPDQVSVVDASSGHIVSVLPAQGVYELGFSPLGTYIITWQRPAKDDNGDAVKNLKVWRTLDENQNAEGGRQVIGQFVQRNQNGWNLQYTPDERLCARVVTNQVQFYESHDLRTVWQHLYVEHVSDFAISPGKTNSVAVFIPEWKGQPAAVRIYNVPSFNAPVSQKTFYKSDKVVLKWNDLGTSLIVLASTDVDKTNKSYYGETNMYLLSANGGFDARITLDKEGPIHDVTWSPNSKEFGVVYGYMPAKTTIFNSRAEPTKAFPAAPRNTIIFSPHGRYVIVAGFGNLAGQMDIYDMSKDYAKVCTIEASNPSVCEWSPDGTHILTATTSPRLRVDNAIRIYHVSGALMYNEEFSEKGGNIMISTTPLSNELYHVTWRPQPASMYPLPTDPVKLVPAPHASAASFLATKKPSTKPAGAYRPPGARGTTTPLHFKREDQGGAAYSSEGISSTSGVSANIFGAGRGGAGRRNFVPGAEAVEPTLPPGAAPGGGALLPGAAEVGDENLSKAALKNKKKREAKKAKDAADGQQGQQQSKGLNAPTQDNDGVPKGPRGPSRSPERRGHHQRTKSGYETQPNHQGRSPQRRSRHEGPPGFPTNGHGGPVNGHRHANGQGIYQQTPQQQQQQQQQAPQQHQFSQPLPAYAQAPPSQYQQIPQQQYVQQHQQQRQQQQPPQYISLPPQPASGYQAPDLTVTSPGGETPQAKKERALKKKLRAIQELKMRQAGGDKLEDTQLKKIATEGGVLKELAELGVTDY